jgi:hypothetical protein
MGGIAVTNLEDALAEGAKKAEAELRDRMKEVIALVEQTVRAGGEALAPPRLVMESR